VIDLRNLSTGTLYRFTIAGWQMPGDDEMMPPEQKTRRFIRHLSIDGVAYLLVERYLGSRQLIRLSTIADVERAPAFAWPDSRMRSQNLTVGELRRV
jgi:hypothetical protein